MAVANKPPVEQKSARRIWKTPGSRLNWLFLAGSLLVLGCVLLVYLVAGSTQTPDPAIDPFREFGIVAFVMVLLVTAYTLRRRFLRRLPGRVQNWLWLHIWFGVASLLIVFLHENFLNITHDFAFTSDRFTEAAFGTSALYALLLLVLTGVIGRLLDIWQARVIATEADTNGVGITRSVEERLHELTLTVERLSAGKSSHFKHYCAQVLHGDALLSQPLPMLTPQESGDFQRALSALHEHARLAHSLRRQQRARLIIRTWRFIHIPLACAALTVITYHSLFELWNMLVLRQ